jgi:uncharacterized membrane protein YedE/YeeE
MAAESRLLGLATGIVFGALLQRGRLTRHEVIIDQLLMRDGHVGSVMSWAIAIGVAGMHALVRRGRAKTRVRPLQIGAVTGGAALFGSGMALLGYCPGTSVAAAGEGHRDATAGVAGMLAGAAAFVALEPRLRPLLQAGGNYGKLTLPVASNTTPLPWIAGIAGSTLAASALRRWPAGPRLLPPARAG